MSISGDSLLISLSLILLPAFIALIGTLLYSYFVIKRYKKVLGRLFHSSFRGVDTERKRIASELHDHLAIHSITFSFCIYSTKTAMKQPPQDFFISFNYKVTVK